MVLIARSRLSFKRHIFYGGVDEKKLKLKYADERRKEQESAAGWIFLSFSLKAKDKRALFPLSLRSMERSLTCKGGGWSLPCYCHWR
jgi:hypothetical protein